MSGKPLAGERTEQVAAITDYLHSLAGAPDCYISVNTFFGRRLRENLKHLTCLMVDLDLSKALERGHDYGGDFMAMRQGALDAISAAGIPTPNLATHTGRGVHLYWLFDRTLPAAAAPRWQACLKVLIELLKPFGADPAVSDTTRVLRLVGTVNSSAPAHCRRVTAEVLVANRVAFDFLADQILPLTRAELAEARAARLVELAPKRALRDARRRMKGDVANGAPQRPGRSFSATATARLTDLTLLAGKLFPHGVPEGSRNRFLFAAACNLAWICREETLESEVLAWKGRHIPDMPDREALATMGSALRKAQEAYQARGSGARLRPFDDPRYLHSCAKLWQTFGPDIEGAGLTAAMQAILPAGMLRERREAARRAKRPDHYTGRGIREANVPRAVQAVELHAQGQSLREIAASLGTSPKTVSAWLELPPEVLGLAPAQPSPVAQVAQVAQVAEVAKEASAAGLASLPSPTSYPQTARVLPFTRQVLPKCSLTNGSAERVLEEASQMRVARADQAPRQASYQANLIPFPRGDAAGQRATRRFDAERLRELRDWSLDRGLEALGLHFKRDASYVPRKADQRVHVSLASGQVVELVLTGIQWFDIAAKHGGGGVIDLAMHLMACDFVTAVRALRSAPS